MLSEMVGYSGSIINHIVEKYLMAGEMFMMSFTVMFIGIENIT